jgi:hypothetical protein
MRRTDPSHKAAYLAGYRDGGDRYYFKKRCLYPLTSTEATLYHQGFTQGTTHRLGNQHVAAKALKAQLDGYMREAKS